MWSTCALFSDSMWTTASFTCEASCNDINSHFSLWWVEADTLQSWNIAQTISWSVSVSHKQGSALFVHALILFCDCPLVNSLSSECGSVPAFETSSQLHHWSLKLHTWSEISSFKTIAPKHLIWSLQWWKGKWQCNGRKSLAQVSKKKKQKRENDKHGKRWNWGEIHATCCRCQNGKRRFRTFWKFQFVISVTVGVVPTPREEKTRTMWMWNWKAEMKRKVCCKWNNPQKWEGLNMNVSSGGPVSRHLN